jgi:Ner family transcriptional regulator
MAEQGWHPQDIMAAVRKRGTSLQALARNHGFAPTTFNKALKHRFPNAHAVIASFIGIERQKLWPQYYDGDGNLRGKSRRDLHRQPFMREAA